MPASCTGAVCGLGTEGVTPEQYTRETGGRLGRLVLGEAKLKAEVRSPQICLRQALMFGSSTPVQFSRNRRIEV